MDKRTITLVVILFLLIVVGMFTFAFLKRGEQVSVVVPQVPEANEPVAYPEITRIDTKHFFIDGVHTYVGEIMLPTPCDLLDVTAIVMESYPEQINLDFTVINNAEVCSQVVTAARFRVDATASELAVTAATFMGRKVELNLVPALPGETPEEFELFIKG
jgi:hypothetical protein